MAIAIDLTTIGSQITDSSSTTYSFTTTGAVASNGFIVLGFHCVDGPTSIVSVADNGPGLTYTVDKSGFGSFSNFGAIISAQAPAGMASGKIITITINTGGVSALFGGCSFTGVKTSSPVDGTVLGPTNTSAATAWTTGNYAVAAGSVIVGYCINTTNASANTPTAPSLENYEGNNGADFGGAMEYRIESGSGSVPVAGAWGTACNSTNFAVAYLEAPPSGPQNQLAWIRA